MNITTRRTLWVSSAAVVGAGALAAVWLVPAFADDGDREQQGRHAGAAYELSADREDGGFEVSFDLDRAEPGSQWVVRLSHDGKVVEEQTVTAVADADEPGDGEASLEVWREDGPGDDVFGVTFHRVGDADEKTVEVTTR